MLFCLTTDSFFFLQSGIIYLFCTGNNTLFFSNLFFWSLLEQLLLIIIGIYGDNTLNQYWYHGLAKQSKYWLALEKSFAILVALKKVWMWNLGLSTPGFNSWPCNLLEIRPWPNFFTSLKLSYSICKRGQWGCLFIRWLWIPQKIILGKQSAQCLVCRKNLVNVTYCHYQRYIIIVLSRLFLACSCYQDYSSLKL